MSAPRCKVCNRPLRDPVSIACGMGPECRGATGSSSSKSLSNNQRRYRSKHNRTIAFAHGDPLTLGDLTYHKHDDKWVSDQGGTLSDKRMHDYLCHYGLVDADDLDRILAAGPGEFMILPYQTQESKS